MSSHFYFIREVFTGKDRPSMVIESGRDTKSFLLKNLWKPWKTLAPIDADAYERGYDRVQVFLLMMIPLILQTY
jgi:hypothetical protein